MAIANQTSLAAILKTLYPQERIKELCYTNNPFMGLVKKRTDFVGKNQVVALRYGQQGGGSSSFATAQANASANAYSGFTVTRSRDYAVGGIDTESIRSAAGKKGALAEGLEEEIDGLTNTITRSLAIALYRNGGGQRGQVASGQGSSTIQLLNPDDIVFFENGMILDGSAADGTSGAVTVGGVNAKVVGIDRDLGTLTNSGAANWNAASAINGLNGASDWFLFRQGDFGLTIKGLSAWLPAVAPVVGGGDSFFGVDRSADATRLAGIRYNGKGGPKIETINRVMARAYREGAKISHVFMNPMDLSDITTTLGSQTVYVRESTSDMPDVGYEGVKLVTPQGVVKCYADPNCPIGTAFALTLDTWTFWSLGEAPGFLDDDSLKMLRSANSDDYQFRLGYFGQLVCDAPGWNVRITW